MNAILVLIISACYITSVLLAFYLGRLLGEWEKIKRGDYK